MSDKKTQRTRLIEVITENVQHLIRLDSVKAFRQLEGLMELTGYISNTSGTATCKEFGEVIIALAGVIDRDSLIDTAHGAVFFRNYRRTGDFQRADRLADDALRACGVDVEKRNAEIEAESERIMAQGRRDLAKRQSMQRQAVAS